MHEKTSKQLYSEVTLPGGELYKPGGWRDMPEIVQSADVIKGFFGEYRWLSNFGKAVVSLDGIEYGTVELAYQAAKWHPEDRHYFSTCTNQESITYNREHEPNKYSPDEWDASKVDVMQFLLEQKFDPELNPDNYQKLVGTEQAYLEETNWWNDTFWGKNLAGDGQNTLGELLMHIRTNLELQSKP